MLQAHVDKEIITTAYKKCRKEKFRNPHDFLDFLQRHSDLNLYGQINKYEVNLLSFLLENRGDSKIIKYDTELSKTYSKVNAANPYQVFFFNVSDFSKKASIKQKVDFLSGFVDDYEDAYSRLSSNAFYRVGDLESQYEFTEWSQILPDVPVTDIIITDPFLFDDHDGTRPLEQNFYKLLEVIAGKNTLERLLVFTSMLGIERKPEILKKSQQILGLNNVYILFTDPCVEHDRYIFMNYHLVNPGNSLNYFNKSGDIKAKSLSKITIDSLCSSDAFDQAQEVLRNLLIKLESAKEKKKVSFEADNRLFYYQKDSH